LEIADMKFGISGDGGPGVGFARIGDFALEIENFGYDGIFLSDHIENRGSFEPWTTLAYIAAKTTTLRLGTTVTPIPRYVPSHLAKIIANVDVLSNGRTIPGFGAGHRSNMFINFAPDGTYPEPQVKVAKYIEGLQVILKLWTEMEPNFRGKYYKLYDCDFSPKPVQKPYPPIWQGGGGPFILKMTAKYFNGWIGPTFGGVEVPTAEAYEAKVRKIREHAKEYNRDMSKFTFVVFGDMRDSAEMIEQYKTAGCQYYIVGLGGPVTSVGPGLKYKPLYTPQEYMDTVRNFAKEIIPSFI